MDKLVTIRLEITCRDFAGKLYTTTMNYFSPNQCRTLISVMSEPQFAVAVGKARKNAGFPYGCYLVGVRDIDQESK